MNKKTSVFSRALLALTSLFTVAMLVIRIILMQTYDIVNGFYMNASLHSVFRYTLFAFTIIVVAASYIYIKEGKNPILLPESKIIDAVSLFPACIFTGFVVYTFAKIVIPTVSRPTTAEIFMALFSAVAVLYFLSANAKHKIGDARALLCTSSALVLLILVFGLYFNPTISYINHSGVLCYAAAIFLMLATVAEANSILKRAALRRYLAFAPVAIVLAFSLSVPDIIYALSNMKAPVIDIFYDIIIFGLAVYHLARLVTIAITKPAIEE
ncbi:MAG: hypothetical protein IJC81_04790 [Clostridia bacterium]|nr:hypothetical protein [Clostridia bacterium]